MKYVSIVQCVLLFFILAHNVYRDLAIVEKVKKYEIMSCNVYEGIKKGKVPEVGYALSAIESFLKQQGVVVCQSVPQ